MQTIHLDSGGKAGKFSLSALPSTKEREPLVRKTKAGELSRMRMFNGFKDLNPAEIQPEQLIDGDPEYDVMRGGEFLDDDYTWAYINPKEAEPSVVGGFETIEVIYTPEGEEKERRPLVRRPANVDALHPCKVMKRFPLSAMTQFVFKRVMQVVHNDDLSYEFLFGLAKELEEKKEMAFVGGGSKGNQPLVLRDGASPFRAFVVGKTEGDKYRLLLLMTDQELKLPEEKKEDEA